MIINLTIAMTITLRCIFFQARVLEWGTIAFSNTRDKDRLFTRFLLLLPFWRANRRLIVNSSTRAHLYLVSGSANRRLVVSIQCEIHFFLPNEMQIVGQLLMSNLESIYLLPLCVIKISGKLQHSIQAGPLMAQTLQGRKFGSPHQVKNHD